MEAEKRDRLIKDFATAINKVSAENRSNTPDFILAYYLADCLEIFDRGVKIRDEWYGAHLEPGNKYLVDDLAKNNSAQIHRDSEA